MRTTPFWVVWSEGGGTPTVMHDRLSEAQREAERLAQNNRGKAFHILQSHGVRVVDSMQRIDTRPHDEFSDEIPF